MMLILAALTATAGMFSTGCGDMSGRPRAGKAGRGGNRPSSRPDSAFEVVCKWHAALAAGDEKAAADFVAGAGSESSALAREMRRLRGSGNEADRKKLEAFKAAAFAPGESDDHRTELTLVSPDGRRIGIVLKKSGDRWMIARLVDRTPPHIDTSVEIARKWYDAIMSGDLGAADVCSYGEAQKRENLNAIRTIRQLSRDAARDPDARKLLETLRGAEFAETELRAAVLVSTGRNSRKVLLENINGRWKVVGNK